MNDYLRWNKCLDELKQCLFCYGHEIHGDEIDSTLLTTDEKEWRQVVCNYCGAGGEMDLELSVAIKAWNTRPIEDDLNEQIKELEKDNRSAKHAIDVWHDSYIELEKQFYAMKKTNLEGKN